MTKGILVLEIDGTDVESYGVFADVASAVDAIAEQERERGGTEDEITQLVERVTEFAEQEQGAPAVDWQFESPFLSVDLRFMTVEVNF